MTNPTPALEVRGIGRRFGGLVALRDVKTLTNLLTGREIPSIKAGPASAEIRGKVIDQLITASDGAVLILRLIDTKKLDKPLADRASALAI